MRKFWERWILGKKRPSTMAEAQALPVGATPASDLPHAPSSGAGLNMEALHAFYGAARRCAMLMLQEADFIEENLPEEELPEDLLAETKAICAALISTKHDVMHELMEMGELASKNPDADKVRDYAKRIREWLIADVPRMDKLVKAVQAASQTNSDYAGASLLITEAMAHVLLACVDAIDAQEALGRD